jgi:hypothetical protein
LSTPHSMLVVRLSVVHWWSISGDRGRTRLNCQRTLTIFLPGQGMYLGATGAVREY